MSNITNILAVYTILTSYLSEELNLSAHTAVFFTDRSR